jgi:hypothetical protein
MTSIPGSITGKAIRKVVYIKEEDGYAQPR